MSKVTIDLPETVLLATGQSREEFVTEARKLLAIKLFELSRLSSGKAADLCGLPRVEFLMTLSQMGIPVADLDEDQIEDEFAHAP